MTAAEATASCGIHGCVRTPGHPGFHTTVPSIAEKQDAAFFTVEYAIHITSKSNGSHGHWSAAAKVAKRERSTILNLVERQMEQMTLRPFELRRVAYTGRFRGLKVQKTKMVRVLNPWWSERLDARLTVTLTRFAQKLLDDDGLRRGFKHIRDGVADAFGVADNDPRLTFEYSQVAHPPSRVTVRIEWRP